MKLKARIYYLYIALVLLYAGLTFLVPPPAAALQKYHVSLLQLRLIDITVLIPYFLIWLAGFYGYDRLKNYCQHIKGSRDGKQVNLLCKGILLLVLWPALSSIAASIFDPMSRKYLAERGTFTIINEYFNLIWPLVGFILIESGARGLSELAKLRPSQRSTHVIALALIASGVLYGYLVSYAFNQSRANYYLPYWVVLATLVIPYIYMWFLGLLAAYQVYLYQRKVSGVVYRRSWKLLSLSIGAIIVLQILVEYANTIITKLAALSLGWYVLLIYIVLGCLAVGYILLAKGAKKLRRIEEV